MAGFLSCNNAGITSLLWVFRGGMPLSACRAVMGEDFIAPIEILRAACWMVSSLERREGDAAPYMLLPYVNFALMVVRLYLSKRSLFAPYWIPSNLFEMLSCLLQEVTRWLMWLDQVS